MTLISLLIALLILCVVFWAVQALLTAFAVADPIRTVVLVLVVLVMLLWVLGYTGLLPPLRLR